MKIKEVYVQNFRSIEKDKMNCSDLTILVGRNSVGKSNLLLALDLFFNTSDKVLTEDMFCSFGNLAGNIVVELTFDRLNQVEKTGRLKKYICASLSHGIRVRKTVSRVEGKLKSRYQGWVEEPKLEWLKSDFKAYRRQGYWQDIGIDFFSYTGVSGGQISRELYEEFRTKYVEQHREELDFELSLSETEFEGLKTVGVDMLPQFKLIPAIGDVSEVVAGTSKSLLARMVRDIVQTATEDTAVLEAAREKLEAAGALINRGTGGERLKQIEAVENWLREEFAEWGKLDFEIRTSFPEVHTLLTQNLQLLVDDGAKGDIATKGHGLQRQLIFKMIHLSAGLVEGEVDWMSVEDVLPKSPPIILAFEEPELYLHPQAQLAFYDDIKKLSNHDQILLCTHSTHLVDIEDFEGVKLLRRESLNAPTRIFECTEDIFGDLGLKKRLSLAKLFDASVNRIFFADKIVIVEGDEEVIGITRVAREHANCFSHRVTIVNAGGKPRIPSLQRVLNAFKVPYTVVYDKDPGDSSSEEIARAIEQLVGDNSPFGLTSSMAMDPDFATTLGYGDSKEGKDAACVKFLDDNKPPADFVAIIQNLYQLPSSGIITPG